MVSRSGMGGGNVLGTIRHTVSPKLWGEVRKKSDYNFNLLNMYII